MTKEIGGDKAREIAIARVQFVSVLNGSSIEDHNRRDYEIFYLKDAYRQFLEAIGDKAPVPTGLDDERL